MCGSTVVDSATRRKGYVTLRYLCTVIYQVSILFIDLTRNYISSPGGGGVGSVEVGRCPSNTQKAVGLNLSKESEVVRVIHMSRPGTCFFLLSRFSFFGGVLFFRRTRRCAGGIAQTFCQRSHTTKGPCAILHPLQIEQVPTTSRWQPPPFRPPVDM